MPAWRITRARLLRLIRTDRHAMSVGMGATGLLSLLLTLALLPKPFGMAHVLAAVGMLQVFGCLYLALSVSAARLRNQSRTPAPVTRPATS